MKALLIELWERVRYSYWFVPGLMALAAIALAFGAVLFDTWLGAGWAESYPWLQPNSPEGARSILATIAGGMITVTGVSFSITVAAVVYAAGQYGPFLLTNFTHDRGNQVTLGALIGTFLYCVLVLRAVGGGEAGGSVPHAAVLLGMVLAVASVGFLIYFIHHVPESIHVSNLVASLGRRVIALIRQRFQRADGEEGKSDVEPPKALLDQIRREGEAVAASSGGYVQHIDWGSLVALGQNQDLVILLNCRAGDFMLEGEPLAWVSCEGDSELDEASLRQIRRAIVRGDQRTPTQDVRFLITQLVEIAARALSPGINDPFTAMNCMNWIAAGLAELNACALPARGRCDAEGQIRVVAEAIRIADFTEVGFAELRPYAAGDRTASLALMKVMARVAQSARLEDQRSCLAIQARMLLEEALPQTLHEADRLRLNTGYREVMARLYPEGECV